MTLKWGTWECPVCNEELDDPDDIYETECGSGHHVMLGAVEANGKRAAWLVGDKR